MYGLCASSGSSAQESNCLSFKQSYCLLPSNENKLTKAYKFLMANGFGYSVRSLKRICQKQRVQTDLIIDVSVSSMRCRVEKYCQKTNCRFYGLAIDATKVAKYLKVNTAYGILCGGAAPNHVKKVDGLGEDGSSIPSDKDMATELKCAILTVQSHPKNVSPFKVIAARPQNTNERCDMFNLDCIQGVESHGVLLSVAFDGLSAESYTIRDVMLNFLEGKTQTVAIVDPNHVGKAIRSQLVLGVSFTTVGETYFDVGLLSLAGVAKNVYQVDDFASHCYFFYLPPDLRTELRQQHAYTNEESIQVKEESELNDFNIDDADTTDALQYAVNLALEDNESKANIHFDQFIPHGLQADALEIVSCEVDSSNSRNLWQILTKRLELVDQSHFQEASDLTQILSMVVECMGGAKQKVSVSINDAQKYNSLRGRWWGKSESVNATSNNTSLKRGLLFLYNSRIYRVLNVFAKSYNKWRMKDLAPATNKTKVQAVAVKEHRFIPEQYKVDSTCDRK